MLIDFSVENFRSFDAEQTFSMVASPVSELEGNSFTTPEIPDRLLKSAVIYGANAAGKRNLLMAMNVLGQLTTSQRDHEDLDRIVLDLNGIAPFALRAASANRPSVFTTRFVCGAGRYAYRVAIRDGKIHEEQLLAYPNGHKQHWFTRTIGLDIDFHTSAMPGPKKQLEKVTPSHRTFLDVAASFGHPALSPVAEWLRRNMHHQGDLLGMPFVYASSQTAMRCLLDSRFLKWVTETLQKADLGIREVQVEMIEVRRRPAIHPENGPTTTPFFRDIRPIVRFIHEGDPGVTAKFLLAKESQGTQQFFHLLSDLYDSLQKGGVILFNKLGTSMHSLLTRGLIRTFNDPALNPKNAQLVFTTHDTTLMSANLFRRDQIWLAEKSPAGATELFSLYDIKNVRKDEAIEDGYLRGRYGAIPWLEQFELPRTNHHT